jgi:hypothetical protein
MTIIHLAEAQTDNRMTKEKTLQEQYETVTIEIVIAVVS